MPSMLQKHPANETPASATEPPAAQDEDASPVSPLAHPTGTDVFISYSRRDKDFVQRLNDALRAHGKKTWVDWEGIPPSAEWLHEIYGAIQSSATILFVISPDSVASVVCGQELQHAIDHSKRLIPVVYRPVPDDQVLPAIRAHNWLFFRDTDDFDKAVEALVSAIDTDLDWAHAHARLLSRAVEWENANRDASLFLQGKELVRAENRLATNSRKKPPHTPLQIDFILASRRHAMRRQRLIGAFITMAVFLTVVLGLVTWKQRVTENLSVANDLRAKAVWALNDNDVLSAESLLARSLSFEDRQDARERFVEAYLRSGRQLWTSEAPKGQHILALGVYGRIALVQDPKGSTLTLWNLALRQNEGPVVHLPAGAAADVACAAFSPDRKYLATGHESGAIYLYDIRAGTYRQLAGHKGGVTAVSFSSDATILGSAGKDLVVRLWDVAKGQPLGTMRGPDETISCLALQPGGKTLAAGSWDNSVWVWDYTTGTFLRRLEGHEDGVLSVAFSPDGQYLASGSWDTNIWLWDAKTGQRLRQMGDADDVYETGGVVSLSFSGDKRHLVSGTEQGIVRLWDVDTGTEQQTIVGKKTSIDRVAFSPDQKELVMAGFNSPVRILDMDHIDRKPEMSTMNGHHSIVSIVSFSPDGSTIISGSNDATVRQWNVLTGLSMRQLRGNKKGIWGVAFRPDGRLLATGSRDSTVRLWDMKEGRLERILQNGCPVGSVAMRKDGKMLASGGTDGTIHLWDPDTGAQIGTIPNGAEILRMLFSPANSLLVVGGGDGIIRCWDTASHQLIAQMEGATPKEDSDGIWALAFDEKGDRMVSGDVEGSVCLWDMTRIVAPANPSPAPSPRSPNSTGAAAQSAVPQMVLRKPLRTLLGHNGGVWDVSLDPAGKMIASAGQDSTIRLWDVDTGGSTILRAHIGAAWSVDFSPDGTRLASGGQDRTVRLWNLPRLKALMQAPPATLQAMTERDTNSKVVGNEVMPLQESGIDDNGSK